MTRPTMSGLFNLLEKLNMCFPNAKSSLGAKIKFKETNTVVLTDSKGIKTLGT